MRIAPPVARALRISVFEGSMWAVYWNVVAGVVINGLALAIGARPLHLAILNALPLLGQVFGLPAARYLQTRDRRKPVVLLAEGVSRGVWLLVPLLLLLPEGEPRTLYLLAVAAVSHLLHSWGAVGWVSWVSDLVPEAIRGVFFGVRTAIVGLVGAIGVTLASLWADGIRDRHGVGESYLDTLLVLVALAVLFGGLSWYGLYLKPVRRMKRLSEPGWRRMLAQLAHGNARAIALTWVALAFSAGITTGLFVAFFLDRLGMSMLGFTIYGWIALIVSTAATPLLGRLADRWGNRTLLLLAWGGVFWLPLLSILTPDDMPHLLGLMPWTILADAVFSGCFWPAVGVAQTNLVIAEAPSEGRAGLFAALSALAGLAGFLGALVGGVISEAIGDGALFDLAGVPVSDLRFPMLVGLALRTLAGFTILRIREPQRAPSSVTSAQAFTIVWRLVTGKPIRPPTEPRI